MKCSSIFQHGQNFTNIEISKQRKMSYPKITQQLLFSTVVSSLDMLKQLTQKLLFSTVVSSLDMLKQSYSGIKSTQQYGHHMNARSHMWARAFM